MFNIPAYLLCLMLIACMYFKYYFDVGQHICYSTYTCYGPYIHLSVTRMNQSKTAEVRIMQFLLYSSPIPLVFAG